MTIFEYFLILLSVILSLGIAHLATGIGELLRSRTAVRWSLPHALWMLIIFLSIIDLWASTWLTRTALEWDILAIIFVLATALATYLAAMWLVPRKAGDEPVDLYGFLVAERRLILGAFLYYLACGIAFNIYLLPPGHFDLANYFIAGPMLIATAIAWITPSRPVQFAVPILGTVLMIIYFAVYFPSIG